ncbi:MAG TPA: YezD family protein [Novosphingobium sp.]|nr:YezD family protein [Novosphingobium sp.]
MVDTSVRTISPEKALHIEESLNSVREALLRLHYGMIALTIHEDRIVQIDVTEKRRLRTS